MRCKTVACTNSNHRVYSFDARSVYLATSIPIVLSFPLVFIHYSRYVRSSEKMIVAIFRDIVFRFYMSFFIIINDTHATRQYRSTRKRSESCKNAIKTIGLELRVFASNHDTRISLAFVFSVQRVSLCESTGIVRSVIPSRDDGRANYS